MPKKLYTDGPPGLQKRINQWLAFNESNAYGYPSAAETFIRISEIAYAAGYDTPPPVTPTLDRVNELTAAREFRLLAELRMVHGAEEASERRAVKRYESLRRWAAEPSAEERAEQARADQDARLAEAAKERRVVEIMAEAEADAVAKRRAAAVKQIEKEQRP